MDEIMWNAEGSTISHSHLISRDARTLSDPFPHWGCAWSRGQHRGDRDGDSRKMADGRIEEEGGWLWRRVDAT